MPNNVEGRENRSCQSDRREKTTIDTGIAQAISQNHFQNRLGAGRNPVLMRVCSIALAAIE